MPGSAHATVALMNRGRIGRIPLATISLRAEPMIE